MFDAHEYAIPASVALGARLTASPASSTWGATSGWRRCGSRGNFPNAQFTTIEADPTNADVLERVVALNQVGTRVAVIRVAGGVRSGSLELVSGLGGRSHAAANIQDDAYVSRIITVPMIDVMPILTRPTS